MVYLIHTHYTTLSSKIITRKSLKWWLIVIYIYIYIYIYIGKMVYLQWKNFAFSIFDLFWQTENNTCALNSYWEYPTLIVHFFIPTEITSKIPPINCNSEISLKKVLTFSKVWPWPMPIRACSRKDNMALLSSYTTYWIYKMMTAKPQCYLQCFIVVCCPGQCPHGQYQSQSQIVHQWPQFVGQRTSTIHHQSKLFYVKRKKK